MAIIDLAQSFGTITEPVVQERVPTERHEFTALVEALNSFVCSRHIAVYSKPTVLPKREHVDMKTGEVFILPEVASYQVRRGFLCLNSNGSIYHKNNGKTRTIGYIRLNDETSTPEFVVKDVELLGNIA